MSRPLCQIIEDMSRVNDGAIARFRLPPQPSKKPSPSQNIKINRNFVKEQHTPRPNKPHGQLNPPPLPIRNSMHPPPSIDIQQRNKIIPPLRKRIAPHGAEQMRDWDIVPPHHRVEHPFETEVGDALERDGEGVQTAHGYGSSGCEPLAG
ncbi:hypothetical protein CDD80_5627 [Ophiocordyceps camponoti-rufipedis]|uniref:Uncharacterized protein n=1 Tax=Ophiocordyceps camponoti-rufipedis TaxID=2004952 RepID=A0A2C5YT94_9HYPO|nr:hypothetical protein CDD80_5627 [Ophiocordyceps camponoti-rufipedis]